MKSFWIVEHWQTPNCHAQDLHKDRVITCPITTEKSNKRHSYPFNATDNRKTTKITPDDTVFRQIPRNATADHEVSAYGYLKRSVYAEFRVHDKFDR